MIAGEEEDTTKDAAVVEMVEEIKIKEEAETTVETTVDGVVVMGLLAMQREGDHLHHLLGMTVIVMGIAMRRGLETTITIHRGDLVQIEAEGKTMSMMLYKKLLSLY